MSAAITILRQRPEGQKVLRQLEVTLALCKVARRAYRQLLLLLDELKFLKNNQVMWKSGKRGVYFR